MQHAGQIVHILDQPIMLGAGARNTDRIAFLEAVRADQRGRNLSGDADQRNGIHQRILKRRHRICGTGTRRHQHHAALAGRARIALGCMARTLLVANEDVLNLFLLEKLVIDRQHRTSRIAEDMLHSIVLEGLQHHFGARHLAACARLLSLCHRSSRLSIISSGAGRLNSFGAIKKAPGRAWCRAWVAMPEGLHPPAHARSYDYECDHRHGRTIRLLLALRQPSMESL